MPKIRSTSIKQEGTSEGMQGCGGMGTSTTTKAGSNVGDLIQKVARSCLFHPVGRRITGGHDFSSGEDEESNDFKSVSDENSRNDSVDVEPLEAGEYEKLMKKVDAMEGLISEVFHTSSALKNAYIRLQIAHTPYDPEKLHLADRAVVAELRRLSDLKQSYRRMNGLSCPFPRTSNGKSLEMDGQKKIVAVYENVIKELKTEVKQKDAEIEFLKHHLRESNKNKGKLERRLKRQGSKNQNRAVGHEGVSSESPTPELFAATVDQVKDAAQNFTKLLISQMKTAKWDIDAAADSIAAGVTYRKQSHRKFAFESYLYERIFQGFENESFYISGSLSSLLEPDKHRRDCFTQFRDMLSMEPAEILNILPDCPFGKFCNKKYLRIVHPKMEEAFFGNFDHRSQVVNGRHPSSEFYQSFLKVAKAVWLLHKLAFSFDHVPSHFHVKNNAVFQPAYMESVVTLQDLEEDGVQLVAFAITPGFKLSEEVIIKSRVYIVRKQGQDSCRMRNL